MIAAINRSVLFDRDALPADRAARAHECGATLELLEHGFEQVNLDATTIAHVPLVENGAQKRPPIVGVNAPLRNDGGRMFGPYARAVDGDNVRSIIATGCDSFEIVRDQEQNIRLIVMLVTVVGAPITTLPACRRPVPLVDSYTTDASHRTRGGFR